ncbi:MAG: alpha-L-rhamnosidase C-terminal domain-containing protein [Acidobacteriaceae bacterium]
MIDRRWRATAFLAGLLLVGAAAAQSVPAPGALDPTRGVTAPQLFSSFHTPLPEQYIWTSEDSTAGKTGVIHYVFPALSAKTEPHYFRVRFRIDRVPRQATLYIAGPRSAEAWVNGSLAGQVAADLLSPLDMHVFSIDVARFLHTGNNVLALQIVRGHGVTGFLNSAVAMQQTFGEVMVAKIVPRAEGIDGPPILISGPQWKATLHAVAGWQRADFDDALWPAVTALGAIEGNIDLLQWNADAGLYNWPGYEGASPFLAHLYLPATALTDVNPGDGSFEHLDALQQPQTGAAHQFTVNMPQTKTPGTTDPSLTFDFGREVTGRLELISDSDAPAWVSIAYGESMGELDNHPYLGTNVLRLAPRASGHGPKSAFRYARVRFLTGAPTTRFKAIHLEDIYYPVHYRGSFDSSDPLLNRIWEVGAYTAHLCMQDDIWDAPKRDRGRWMGDTDVSGRVISTAFGDDFLLEDTLTRLVGKTPVDQHVNGIPGYSSFWFTELANYDRHSGQEQYVAGMHDRIVQLLQLMDREFDAQNQFINRTKAWLFVDWAMDLNGDTPQAREATVIEYIRAYRQGAWMLRQLGDTQNAEYFEQRADALRQAIRARDWADGSYGLRWQTNAMAVLAGVADPSQYASIWNDVLSNVGKPTWRPDIITPYYGAYVLDAMAEMHHRADALRWIREYWGGMLHEGATSFWEAYDPAWPKDNPHVDLQADGRAGYFVSLAHGWSAGPVYWLTEQVLGIQPTAAGFSKTTIRPDLVDLAWARGVEPTPQGLLRVDLRRTDKRITENQENLDAVIDLPDGVEATVLFPVSPGTNRVLVNGTPREATPAEDGSRLAVALDHAGHYELRAIPGGAR